MNINASALQAFGEGVATTAWNIVRASERSVIRLGSVYQEGAGGNVEHHIIPASQKAPIDLSREMVTLMQTEIFHKANAVVVRVQDEILETSVGLNVDKNV